MFDQSRPLCLDDRRYPKEPETAYIPVRLQRPRTRYTSPTRAQGLQTERF